MFQVVAPGLAREFPALQSLDAFPGNLPVQHSSFVGRERDVGELNYSYLFRLLDDLNYRGWVGCEYRPRGSTSSGLDWLKPLIREQKSFP